MEQLSHGSRTVLGGAGVMALGELMEPFAHHNCRGDGVAFFRELLGQDPAAPLAHPTVWSVHWPNVTLGWEANPASYGLVRPPHLHRRRTALMTRILQLQEDIFNWKGLQDPWWMSG